MQVEGGVGNMTKVLFYVLNLTWGIPMNIIGGLAALGLYIGAKDQRATVCVGATWLGENIVA